MNCFKPLVMLCLVVCLSSCAALSGKRQSKDITSAEKAYLSNPMQQRAALKRAEDLYQKGQLEAAKSILLKLSTVKVEQEYISYRLGTIDFKLGLFEPALSHFQSAAQINPRNTKAHYNIAVIYLMFSENHFKYHTATLKGDEPIDKISKLLVDIDDFLKP
jgi:Flp pilus assembly protein TadD